MTVMSETAAAARPAGPPEGDAAASAGGLREGNSAASAGGLREGNSAAKAGGLREGNSAAKAGGLRERKKARTRASIREHALRLFREHGYHNTTVEHIAEAAEVSPSTFFRYFPTKEDVVLQDDFDVLGMKLFEAQPADLSPIGAYRAAAAQMFATLTDEELARFRESTELMLTIPEVRARALDEFARTIDVTAAAIAKRAGRSPDDFEVRNLAGALIGVIMAATMPWAEQPSENMIERIDAAMAHLEAGLPL
jgi:AcrR family transcriptional regulator